MEERPPGVDYAVAKDDPSKTDYPHATETPGPAGKQAQGKGERSLAGCCVLSGYATHIWSVCKFPVTQYCWRSFNYNPRFVQSDQLKYRVRYLLSATMYYQPLDLRNRWTNRLKSSTN